MQMKHLETMNLVMLRAWHRHVLLRAMLAILLVLSASPIAVFGIYALRWIVPEGLPVPPAGVGFQLSLLMIVVGFGAPVGMLVEVCARRRWECVLAWLGVCALVWGSRACIFPLMEAAELRGVTTISRKGAPLVNALKSYKAIHGEYPHALSELVPAYLSKVPTLGLAAIPSFEYQCVKGQRFYLTVGTRITFLDFSACVYDSTPDIEESWPTLEVDGWQYYRD
jgi:hypothetical protein